MFHNWVFLQKDWGIGAETEHSMLFLRYREGLNQEQRKDRAVSVWAPTLPGEESWLWGRQTTSHPREAT